MNAATAALIKAAFGSPDYPLAAWYAGLLVSIPPLAVFTSAHTTKIRKKARLADTPAAQRDLRCELAVAALLAADRRSLLRYEPLAAAQRRGPDFLLRYKGHTDVYSEVSRLRPPAVSERDPEERFAAVLCGKLSQLIAGAANLLVLVNDAGAFTEVAINAAIAGLRRRASAGDDVYFALRGLSGARELQRRLPVLTGVLLASPGLQTQTLMLLAGARHALPPDLARTIDGGNLAQLLGPPTEAGHHEPE